MEQLAFPSLPEECRTLLLCIVSRVSNSMEPIKSIYSEQIQIIPEIKYMEDSLLSLPSPSCKLLSALQGGIKQ